MVVTSLSKLLHWLSTLRKKGKVLPVNPQDAAVNRTSIQLWPQHLLQLPSLPDSSHTGPSVPSKVLFHDLWTAEGALPHITTWCTLAVNLHLCSNAPLNERLSLSIQQFHWTPASLSSSPCLNFPALNWPPSDIQYIYSFVYHMP